MKKLRLKIIFTQRKLYSKQSSKCVTAVAYIHKILIILSATTGGVCIISRANVVGAPVGMANAALTIVFFLAKEIIKKLLSTTRNKKKA